MESIFIINKFEDGYSVDDMYDDVYAQESYCIEVLEIPDEKINATQMIGNGFLEVVLEDIDQDEIDEDWYVNLSRLSS